MISTASAAPVETAGLTAIFAHDHRFIPDGDTVWSDSQFEADLWRRYLQHFDRLAVVARHGTMPPGRTAADLERSSRPGVDFTLLPNLSRPASLIADRRRARHRIAALVDRHDAVIARLPSEIGLLAIRAAEAAGKPWAAEVVGCPWDGLRHYGTLAGRLYAPLARRRMQRAVARAPHAIYVTERFLQGRYPTGAANSAGVSDVTLSEVSQSVLDARLGRLQAPAATPLRLGLIGTLRGRFKGIQTLLAALAAAQKDLPPIQLHILGGGDAAPWIAEARRLGVAGCVNFDGTRPAGGPVLDWLDGIDIYLQPSFKEGLPRALVEAMSRACPAIASDVAGIPELLPSEDLVGPGDVDALARLLRRRAGDLDWMRDRARRNWTRARDFRNDALDRRRNAFWARFAEAARDRKVRA